MADEQTSGTEQSGTPEWIATFAGDNADMQKSLATYKTPQDFYGAFTAQGAEIAKLKESGQFDWRKAIAGSDESASKLLERYATPDAFGKAHLEAVKKISAGEFAKPLPANATAEQVAAWRQANGIPEKPEAYFEKLPNGRVIGEADKAMFDEVAKELHGLNVQPAVIHKLVDWYYGMADKETATLAETDQREKQEFEDSLRQAWGNDYRANMNHLGNFMQGLSPELQKAFGEGFGGDGKKLMHNPAFVQWMASIAREFNPAGFVTPGGNENQMQSIDQELANLTKMSGNQHSDYWKGPMAEKHQARMRELLAAKDKLSKRVA